MIMKNTLLCTVVTLCIAMVSSACTTYEREPDFRKQLTNGSARYLGNSYMAGWLPSEERYTQRFTWKMARVAKSLVEKLDPDPEIPMPVLLVTTIVPVDNLYKATSFGRLVTEQLITELSRQGLSIVEARKTDTYIISDGEGEFSLSRKIEQIGNEYSADAVLVGSYSKSGDQVLVNVRLVDAKDSHVIVASGTMMNLKGDRFINDLFLKEDSGVSRHLPEAQPIRLRKHIVPDLDSNAEIVESQIATMAGTLAEGIRENISDDAKFAVVTFVDIDNMSRAATFGRYITDQLIGELKSLGFHVQEVRLASDIFVDIRIGELALSRAMNQVIHNTGADFLLLGTYTKAGDNIAVAARVVDAGTQEVISSGRIIVDAGEKNKFVTAMLENEVTSILPSETVEGF